ncbi:MAG: DUF2508 family protein [Candidatus Pristimantibacillus sp.]
MYIGRGKGKVELDNLSMPEGMDTIQWTEHLRDEIVEAHQEWLNANRFFDHAVGRDQIDYAIYAIITAEKRYESLLRIAKRTCKVWPEWRRGLR